MKIKYLLSLVIAFAFFQTSYAKVYAVIVGVEKYDGTVTNLTASVDDAVRVYNFLAKSNTRENILLLTDHKATKQNILQAMQIFSLAKPEDTIIFYFSGHGHKGLFCPTDVLGGFNALYHSDIKKAFKKSKAKVKLCIADACYSGSIVLPSANVPTGNNNPADNIIVFMSSTQNEISLESPAFLTGYFTAYFIKGLSGKADADKNRIITAYELYRYVKQNVVKMSKGRQTPVMFGKFDKHLPIASY